MIQLRDFRNIRPFLTHDASVSVANAFVSSQLGYCNSLFRTPETPLATYQFRSEFKLATLGYKFNHTGFPKYFAPHLSTYCTTYNTRHSQSVANFLSLLSSSASVLPLMLPLFGNHFLKTFMYHPLLPLLERSSKPIHTKGISSLAHFLLWRLRGADLFLSLDFELGYCYCVVAP